jgi:hypothetical protein
MYFFVIFGSMITPLMYCSDFRPYFTIHDSEFKEYTTKAHAPPPVILGVTNPFFAKTLQHWPHIIRICDTPHLCKFVKYFICIMPFLCAISVFTVMPLFYCLWSFCSVVDAANVIS